MSEQTEYPCQGQIFDSQRTAAVARERAAVSQTATRRLIETPYVYLCAGGAHWHVMARYEDLREARLVTGAELRNGSSFTDFQRGRHVGAAEVRARVDALIEPQWRSIPNDLPETSMEAFVAGRNWMIDHLRAALTQDVTR